MRKAPHKTVKRFSRNGLYLNLRPARQPEHDPVLAVNRHAVHQPGPQALVELGDELRHVEFPVRVELVHHPDERGLDLILSQVRCLAAGFVFEGTVYPILDTKLRNRRFLQTAFPTLCSRQVPALLLG